MKNRVSIKIAFCLSIILSLHLSSLAQFTVGQEILTIEGLSIGSGDYYARDEVRFIGNSDAWPHDQAHIVWLHTDKNIQLDAQYGHEDYLFMTNNVNSPIDYNLPVGAINGHSDVTSGGQSTYDIPISVPPGTNGLVPTLSINYNSAATTGVLGRGWNIGGISAISRSPKDFYHDGMINNHYKQGIKLDNTDAYSLDGQRIIGDPFSGTGARLENDNFSRITFTNGYFILVTKSGLTMEYGGGNHRYFASDNNAKLMMASPNVPLAWYLSKVYDSHGNYISYIYYNQNDEVSIKEIDYTGTSSAVPYNTIKFFYDNRADKSAKYLLNNIIKSSLILREIEIDCEGNYAKGYKFTYGKTSQTFLEEISEFGSDYTKLNSTYIRYGSNTSFNNTVISTQPKNQNENDLMTNASYRVGDFNGDGLSDLVAFQYDQMWPDGTFNYTGVWRLYLNDPCAPGVYFTEINPTPQLPSPFFPYAFRDLTSNLSPAQVGFQSADFNMDGLDDIVICNTTGGNTNVKIYYSTGNDFICNTQPNGQPVHPDLIQAPLNVTNPYFISDVDGDGIPEGIQYYPREEFKVHSFKTGTVAHITQFLNSSNQLVSDIYHGFNPIDFDGDGIQEIQTTRGNLSVVIKLKLNTCWPCSLPEHQSKEIYSEFSAQSYSQEYFGDFNGDGITDNVKSFGDFLHTRLRYGTGTGYTALSDMTSGASLHRNNKFLVMDLNYDGIDDFITLDKTGGSTQFGFESPSLSYGFGAGGYLANFPDMYDCSIPDDYNDCIPSSYDEMPEFLTGDFDGDGKSDIFYKVSNYNGRRFIAYYNRGAEYHLVSTISDGFRNKVNYEYATLANDCYNYSNNIYIKDHNAPSNAIDIQTPMYVVSQITTSDGIGGTNKIQYNYEGAQIHVQGKGFLGFNKLTATNYLNSVLQGRTESNYVLNPYYFERTPSLTETYSGTVRIADATYSCSFTPTLGRAHYVQTNDIVSHDYVSGKTVRKHFDYTDGWGNINYSSTETDLGPASTEKSEETTTYENAGSWSTSILNAPASVIATNTRTGGGGSYTRRTNYEHFADGEIKRIINDPSTDHEVIESFDYYYPIGVCSTKTVSATPVCTTCVEKSVKFEYDSKYRFVTKELNIPLNQATESTYDPKFGTPLTVKGVDGLTTFFSYDGYGRKIRERTPDNLVTNIKYEWVQSAGDVPHDRLGIANFVAYSVSSSRPGNPGLRTFYDKLGRELETESDGFAEKIYTQKRYDSKGNLWEETGNYFASSSSYLKTTNFFETDHDVPNVLKQSTLSDGSTSLPTYFNYDYLGNGEVEVTSTLPDGKVKWKVSDATGKVILAHDDGGNINYDYYSNTKVRDIIVNGVQANHIHYDGYGYEDLLTDKDAGTIQYRYDAFGQLVSQTDARTNNFTMKYDVLGRIMQKDGPPAEGSTFYYYNGAGNGINKISSINNPTTGVTYSYAYDGLNRMTSYSESIPGQTMQTSYQYDINSNVIKEDYPGGFSIMRSYDNHGYATEIKNGSTSIWQANTMNSFGQYDKYTLGNGIQTQISVNNFGMPEIIDAGNVHHLEMNYDLSNGNLNWRKDFGANHNLSEDFYFDNLDRLNTSRVTSPLSLPPLTRIYNPNGTIDESSFAGTYSDYASAHPDGVEKITSLTGEISTNSQDITYDAHNKVQQIQENGKSLDIFYGLDEDRKKTILTDMSNQSVLYTKYFHDNFEKLVTASHAYEINYINSPTGLCAINVKKDGDNGTMYYVYSDHLGSILKLTEANGNIYTEQSFDAWGRNRNPDDWTYNNVPSVPEWLTRGFTGHEHLNEFALINMNGRCYDPIVGMMLSPDNDVQAASNTQNYNRYSYSLNNPLKYTDPSGQNWLGDAIYWSLNTALDLITVPGRLLSGATSWVNDRVNNISNKNGYFNSNYIFSSQSPYPTSYPGIIPMGGIDHSDFFDSESCFTDASGRRISNHDWDNVIAIGSAYNVIENLATSNGTSLAFNATSLAYSILDGTFGGFELTNDKGYDQKPSVGDNNLFASLTGGAGDYLDLTDRFNKQIGVTHDFFSSLGKSLESADDATRLTIFGGLVMPGGPFDLKRHGWGKRDIGEFSRYNGEVFRFDDYGNYNYGVAGKAYGYSLSLLKKAGGLVQILTLTSKWEYWSSNFDDPQDRAMVMRGYYRFR
jgi:RHS repeat-associated protein